MSRKPLGPLGWLAIALTLLVAALSMACKIEEELAISGDGSGSYRARVSVEKQFAEAIGELKKQAAQKGFEVAGEGETADVKYLDVRRDFKSVSELNDDEDEYSLASTRESWLKGKYSLVLNFRSNPSASNFQRRIVVTLPASIISASAGEVSGRSVSWDCSRPGLLRVEAEGLSLPLTATQMRLVGATVVVGVLLLGVIRVRRRRPRPLLCPKCNEALEGVVAFCPRCGNPSGPARAEA